MRRLIGCGLIAGMTLKEIMRAAPGFVMDMYLYKQDYDDVMHGIRRGE